MPNVSAKEKALLHAAQHAVKVAKFQDLPRKLNALQKAVTRKPVTTSVYLDKMLEIIRAYPLDVEEADQPLGGTGGASAAFSGYTPDIILSESFSLSPEGDRGLPQRTPAMATLPQTKPQPVAEPDTAQFLGRLSGTVNFGKGWEDPLPPGEWEALQ